MHNDPILVAFERRYRRRPDAPMVLGRCRQANADDVERLARAAAAGLARADPGAGALIALAVANGPGFLAGLLAVRRAAGSVLLLDDRAPESEQTDLAGALGAAALLRGRGWPRHGDDFTVQQIETAPGRDAVRLPREIAVVKLTSGSTGRPRGILTPSRALVADEAALTTTMDLRDDERILAAIPMSHSYGLSSVALPALMRDAVLVVPEPGHPLAPIRAARDHEATFLPTVPAFLQALVKMAKPPPAPPTLRLVTSAGAPLATATARRFREIYDRGVHVFYGASECGGICFDRTGIAAERGTLGRPVDGVEVTLAPAPAADGATGTVTVTSPAVTAGYLGEADPSLAGGVFRTTDLAGWRDGELVLEGRLDGWINVKGKKVDPREIERALHRLDGVEEAIVLGVARPGEAGEMVRCFVAGDPARLSDEGIRAWCRRHLAEHKVPRGVVLLAEIPKTSRGKTDRAALIALAESRDRGGHD